MALLRLIPRGLAPFGLALAVGTFAATASADTATPWSATEHTQVRLVAAAGGVGDAATVPLGLHFRMAKGWKIYWRSPGDAGFPPRPDWAGSTNLKEATIAWPAPERFSVLGLETLGYHDEVVLPIAATLSAAGTPLALKAKVDFLTCDQICIPYTVNMALTVPVGAAGATPHAHLVSRFAARVPGDGRGHGIALEQAGLGGTAAAPSVRVVATAAAPFAKPDLFVEGPSELLFAKPKVQFSDSGRRAVFDVAVDGAKEFKGGLVDLPLTFTLVDGGRAAEGTLKLGAAAPAAPARATSLAWILLFALLGGLILNLMPCVLPVLSLKLLGVVGHGGGEIRTVRLSFVASALGIVFSFLLLAGSLVAVKASGAAVGWGIQFQHPWFLIALTLVVALFACNLWGFFEVRLPIWMADLGERSSHVHGLGGHFLTGMFATLLATPCSAPFLGTAVGFALARGAGEIAAVFLVLGLGLALPYLLVAAFPGLAVRLPRPGRWMVRLKLLLGLALAATAAWLIGVLDTLAGAPAASVVAIAVVGVGLALYARHRSPQRLGRIALAATAALAVAAFLAPAGLATLTVSSVAPGKTGKAGFWRAFEPEQIPVLVASGKTVFVDVTADWCITCQVNKTLVLTKGDVVKRLTAGDVVPMQADWTRPNDAIARYLAEFQRYGIPFNVVYGPGAPEGIPLSEVLTPGEVLDALSKAKGKSTAVLNK